jgi:hypothetical protein
MDGQRSFTEGGSNLPLGFGDDINGGMTLPISGNTLPLLNFNQGGFPTGLNEQTAFTSTGFKFEEETPAQREKFYSIRFQRTGYESSETQTEEEKQT